MEPRSFEQVCRDKALEMAELVIRKQRDYGHDNINAFGEFGILVRVNDKVARLRNLIGKDKTSNNESLDDTWRDIVGYGLVALMFRNGDFNLELEKDNVTT